MSNPIRKSATPLRQPAPRETQGEAPRETQREVAAPALRPGSLGGFPQVRLRRNRSAGWVRRLVAENRLGCEDLVWQVCVHDGQNGRATWRERGCQYV